MLRTGLTTTIAFPASSATDMLPLTVSLFTKEDISAIVEIEAEQFSTPFKEKDFLDILNSEISNVLVVKANGVLCGYVSFTVIIDECQIINFATKEEFKRQGVGSFVMQSLFEHCEPQGVIKYFLEVRESNNAAISLYEKYGFVPVGISKNHFSAPRENAILMNLEL